MERFIALSTPVKLAIIFGACALFVGIVLFFGRDTLAEEEEPSVGIPQGPVPTETAEPNVEPTEEAEPYVPGIDNGGDLPPVENEQTNLSPEDVAAAIDRSVEGILAYYLVNLNEPLEARQARLSGIIDPESPMWNTNPLGDDIEDTYEEASIVYAEPIGGTAEDFRMLISLDVKAQINPPSDSGERPQIFDSRQVVEVATKKVGDQWLIWAYREQ